MNKFARDTHYKLYLRVLTVYLLSVDFEIDHFNQFSLLTFDSKVENKHQKLVIILRFQRSDAMLILRGQPFQSTEYWGTDSCIFHSDARWLKDPGIFWNFKNKFLFCGLVMLNLNFMWLAQELRIRFVNFLNLCLNTICGQRSIPAGSNDEYKRTRVQFGSLSFAT